MSSEQFKRTQIATGGTVQKIGLYGLALGVAALLAMPANVSAAPLSTSAASGGIQAAILEQLGAGVQLVHCCHSHPYPPYDDSCCHESGAYAAGAVAGAAVAGAVAYGAYRGVRSSVHVHHYHGGRPGGGRPVARPAGGRRSDIRLKDDIALLGRLDNGLGFYRFRYKGEGEAYVGVMAQEVQRVIPNAVARGTDGYLRVYYEKLGVVFQTYKQWLTSGAHLPSGKTLTQAGTQ